MGKHRAPRARLSNTTPHDNGHRALPAPEFDVEEAFGVLQGDIGQADALIYATEKHLERFRWRCCDEGDEGDDPLNHLAHLLGAARAASRALVLKSEIFAGKLVQRPEGRLA